MKGKDGHMYKVIKTKSGKRWLKILISNKRTKRGSDLTDKEKLRKNVLINRILLECQKNECFSDNESDEEINKKLNNLSIESLNKYNNIF